MIRLEPFSHEDIDQFISWIKDERFLLMFAGPKYKMSILREQLLEDIKESEREYPKILMYKVVSIPGEQMIGHIQLIRIDWERKKASIGRVLIGDDNIRGKGIGTEIMKEMLKIGFENLNLEEISLNVFDFNISAIKCYEKLGFEIVKVNENVVQIDNESWNSIVMSITNDKYKTI